MHMQEEQLLEKGRKAQRDLGQLREEHGQRMRAEEERLRGLKEQGEVQLAAKAVRRRHTGV